MDVFYELMIKMIRISLRRLIIETFTLDKFSQNLKKETIKEIFKNSETNTNIKDKSINEHYEIL